MGSNLAGVSVFSDLRLTRIWVAIVRNPRPWHPFWYKNSPSSGLDPAGVSVFSDLRLTSLWEAIISNPRFCLCLAFGCFGTGPKHCFLWVPKVTWGILSTCSLLLAGVRVLWSRTKALFFLGSKSHVRHSFGVFFAWHGLDSCWRSVVSEPKLCLLWVPKVTWSILSACFLLGMGSNLAGVSVFSNLTLTRLWVAIVRNPRFERFFAWQRLDCCWRSGVSEPKLCFFLMGSKGDGKHSVCVFFAWHGLESCWCFGLFESDADETLSSHRSESTFRTVFCLAEARLLLAFRCFGTEALFFIGSKGDVKHSVCVFFCLAWARILLVFRSFRIWRWRDFEQPSFGIHGVRVFRNRTKALFFSFFLYF